MSEAFRTRKEQIEKGFLPQLMRALKAAGCPLNAKGQALVKKELRGAAMVGAVEERARALWLLRHDESKARVIRSVSVLSVLGYED